MELAWEKWKWGDVSFRISILKGLCFLAGLFGFTSVGIAQVLVNLDFENDTVGQKPVVEDATFSPGSNNSTNGTVVIDSTSDPPNPLSGKSLYIYDLSGDLVSGNNTHFRFPFNGGTNRTEVRLSFDFQRAYPAEDTDTRVHVALGRVENGNQLNNSDFRPFQLRLRNDGNVIVDALENANTTVASYDTEMANSIDVLANSHDTDSVEYDLTGLGSGTVAPNSFHLFFNGEKMGEYDFFVTPDPANAPGVKFNERDDDLGQFALFQDSKRQGGIVFDNIVLSPINTIVGPPDPPEALTLRSSTPFSVELEWTDASDDETRFFIERRTGSAGNFETLATVTSNVTTYTDESVSPLMSYTYRILADNGFKSDPSNELLVETPEQILPIIRDFEADEISVVGSTASFSVSAAGRDPLTYQWYRGESGVVTQPIAGANQASYKSEPLFENSNFWVRVSNLEGHVDSQTFSVQVRDGITYTVRNRSEIENTLERAMPGDTLELPNGTYEDLVIHLEGQGEENAPITLKAETPGKVILLGESRVQIGGQWLVLEGLVFTGPYSGNDDDVIQFRSGGRESEDCRVTEVSIIDYVPENGRRTFWVSMHGERNRVDHCYFSGHDVSGVTVVAWLDGEPNYHRIDHNHFANRIDGGENGWETIRIGTSTWSMSNSRTTVEYNLFTRVDGEIEIISNKSCENTYRYNTFLECGSMLTLRHGNRCLVEGNYFLGGHRERTGGVRVIGEDHVVINNYFEGTMGRDGAVITLYPGVPGGQLNEYFAAHNAVVAFNTLYNNSSAFIDVSANLGTRDRTILPTGMVIANNIFAAGSYSRGDFVTGTAAGSHTWSGNLIFGRTMGAGLTGGFQVVDPLLERDEGAGIYRIGRGSPAIDAAASISQAVELDIDGQVRSGALDVGADERSDEPGLTHGPLRVGQVGPGYDPARRPINATLAIPLAVDGRWPNRLSETGAFKNLIRLEPEDGILSYQPNVSEWSDYAEMTRWFHIPGGATMTYSEDGNWRFPQGSVWIQHFDLELERGDPSSAKRIETRFLVKTEFGVHGASYAWNDAGTEATLVVDDGVDFDLTVMAEGESRSQTWSIPSRSDCLQCHSITGGYVLGFNTRQLNRPRTGFGTSRNFLDFLDDGGFFDGDLGPTASLPYFISPEATDGSLDLKARSYLAVNCASCHQPGGTESGGFDVRPHRTLARTGLIDGLSMDAGLKLVTRGKPDESSLLTRMLSREGTIGMPPLDSKEIDPVGTDLIRRWIAQGLAEYLTFEEWRDFNFGDSKDVFGKGEDDADYDGDSNWLEYLNQTDPLSAMDKSYFRLTPRGRFLALVFNGGDFAQYHIEFSADLTNWLGLWDGGSRIFTLPEGEDRVELILTGQNLLGSNRFYRLRVTER